MQSDKLQNLVVSKTLSPSDVSGSDHEQKIDEKILEELSETEFLSMNLFNWMALRVLRAFTKTELLDFRLQEKSLKTHTTEVSYL